MNASSYEPDIYGIQQIDSVDEHYFYSHQKPTKLVYEIRLIVLWGKLETSSWFLLYIGSAQLIRTYVFLKIGFWWKNPLPSTLRCPRKLLYQYSRAIFIHFGSFERHILNFCASVVEKIRSHRGEVHEGTFVVSVPTNESNVGHLAPLNDVPFLVRF